ncbi:SDR family oxidoreductase [Trinickia violacea]|uniref:SDR family oxidoreductase n=1 Tax=Trinickia violacea TaxID=2571746 RepID=UPI0026728BA7|nr:SDR family oxidoreductase [Trinickia violacea]
MDRSPNGDRFPIKRDPKDAAGEPSRRSRTPILDAQSATREDLVSMYQSMVPLGRLARVEEMASSALFLASDQSSYMTGADLMNDGGIGQV